MTRMSTASPFDPSARRWCTPKRCCSSTTARPRSRNSTSSWNRAWVPTTMLIAPSARASSTRRRHEGRLPAGLDGGRHGQERDGGLARPDVALEEAQHALVRGEVGADFLEGPLLRAGEREGQGGDDLRRNMPVAGVAAPGQRLVKGGEAVLREPGGVLPFGQARQPLEGGGDELADEPRREPFREAI